MRLSAVMSRVHHPEVDPVEARDADYALVAALRDRLDGITFFHGSTPRQWDLHAVCTAAYLSADAFPLAATVRGLPLGVLNPVELAEQLATLDHAWEGRFDAGVVVGCTAVLARHGIPADRASTRFEESLGIMRAMWSEPRLSGTGPNFVFEQVQPTLLPHQEGGPPVELEVSDRGGAAAAARLRLGAHLRVAREPDDSRDGAWIDLLTAYRHAGGGGSVSISLALAEATVPALAALAAADVDRVDVVFRRNGTALDALLRDLDELTSRLRVVRGD
jgi:alkanesulfonate monooxygenase SsuD/methylene tetrahydromethanopterin reductase-like flavin-dependent oxidoreductase (luciferase family)